MQCNSKEHVNRNIRKDKNADRKAGMVFWPWATNFRSIAHERRISDTPPQYEKGRSLIAAVGIANILRI